jgi:hypothetical protein
MLRLVDQPRTLRRFFKSLLGAFGKVSQLRLAVLTNILAARVHSATSLSLYSITFLQPELGRRD